MKFTKMHGTGNDYIFFNCFEESIEDPSSLSVKLSDRHFGIGGDGIILICPSKIADFKMRIFNSDGSEAQMCGNGIRCFGKYVYDKGLTEKTELSIETLAGIKHLTMSAEDGFIDTVLVDMGEPAVKADKIPVLTGLPEFIDQPVKAGGTSYKMTCVNIGNPHGVIFSGNISQLDLAHIGPKLENHRIFPERANIEFVEVVDERTLKMRVWERGSGETLACGTGACASLVAAVLNGRSSRRSRLILLGGELDIEWSEDNNHVYMTGSAQFVFDGEI